MPSTCLLLFAPSPPSPLLPQFLPPSAIVLSPWAKGNFWSETSTWRPHSISLLVLAQLLSHTDLQFWMLSYVAIGMVVCKLCVDSGCTPSRISSMMLQMLNMHFGLQAPLILFTNYTACSLLSALGSHKLHQCNELNTMQKCLTNQNDV